MKVDNYNLEKSIRKLSFYELYLTTKKDDPKIYATKVYNREEVENSEMVNKYLKNEIYMLKNLVHPNIIKIQDVKKSKKNYFIIEEYCNGGRLSEALNKYTEINGKSFSEEIIQHLMRQIIDAFKYIHSHKIVYLSVVLDNILLNYENEEDAKNFNLMKAQIKIINFDCAVKLPSTGLIDFADVRQEYNFQLDPFFLQRLNTSSKKKALRI